MKFSAFALVWIALSALNHRTVVSAQDDEDDMPHNVICTDVEADCVPCELQDPMIPDTRRRRYEIRDMPRDQWEAYVDAMWTMKNLTMGEGQAKYGPLFKTHDYMVLSHAVAVTSQRGDQIHFSASFASWHAAFSLMYETTLMQIAQVDGNVLEGVPYFWNLDENVGEVLSPDFFGTHPGLGPNFEVTDGRFAYWPVSRFNMADYEEYMVDPTDTLYAGNEAGSLRAPYNQLNSSYVTAFPSHLPGGGVVQPYTGASYEENALPCLNMPYDVSSPGMWEFNKCVETPNGVSNWHSNIHVALGGGPVTPESAGEKFQPFMAGTRGDLFDPVTSPNHPIFPTFHSTYDMFLREWQAKHPEGKDISWGFPYANADLFRVLVNGLPTNITGLVNDGINALDAASSAFPMTWADLGWATPDAGNANQPVTHVDITCRLAKANAPYVYVQYSGAPEGAPGVPLSELEGSADEGTSPASAIRGLSLVPVVVLGAMALVVGWLSP